MVVVPRPNCFRLQCQAKLYTKSLYERVGSALRCSPPQPPLYQASSATYCCQRLPSIARGYIAMPPQPISVKRAYNIAKLPSGADFQPPGKLRKTAYNETCVREALAGLAKKLECAGNQNIVLRSLPTRPDSADQIVDFQAAIHEAYPRSHSFRPNLHCPKRQIPARL